MSLCIYFQHLRRGIFCADDSLVSRLASPTSSVYIAPEQAESNTGSNLEMLVKDQSRKLSHECGDLYQDTQSAHESKDTSKKTKRQFWRRMPLNQTMDNVINPKWTIERPALRPVTKADKTACNSESSIPWAHVKLKPVKKGGDKIASWLGIKPKAAKGDVSAEK